MAASSPFPVIIGPTAGGKSDLAVEVALRLGGGAPGAAEVITADSVQIYRGLDVGSAKPSAAERREVPHHLIDIVEPTEAFTVSDWLAAAERAIGGIRARDLTPVLAGGTHLYIKAFLDGLFEGPEPDPILREELRARGLPALRAELQRVDPAAAARIHANDERRTIRALEVYHQTGIPISTHQRQWDAGRTRRDCVVVGLDWPAELLNRRINARVRQMMDAGLLEEVRGLHRTGRLGPQAREALGYKQLVGHLEGRATLEEAVEAIKIETRRFAKNQRTWLRRLRTTPGSVWIDAETTPREEWAEVVLRAMGARP
jgi:tRNA dimethylallyltransferase